MPIAKPSKRHHTVPELYLTRFANYERQVWVYDKLDDRSFVTSIDNVCVERDFHTLDLPGGPPDEFERLVSQYEDIYAKGFANLGKVFPPSLEVRAALSLFIGFQYVRTGRWREIALRSRADMSKWMLQMMNSAATTDAAAREWMRSVIDLEMTDDELDETINWGARGDYDIRVPPAEYLRLLAKFLEDSSIPEMLAARSWTLLYAERGSEFLISDEPIALTVSSPGPVGLGTAEAVLVPVDRSRLLRLTWREEDEGKRRSLYPAGVSDVNAITIRNARRQVIGHPRFARRGDALVRAALAAAPEADEPR